MVRKQRQKPKHLTLPSSHCPSSTSRLYSLFFGLLVSPGQHLELLFLLSLAVERAVSHTFLAAMPWFALSWVPFHRGATTFAGWLCCGLPGAAVEPARTNCVHHEVSPTSSHRGHPSTSHTGTQPPKINVKPFSGLWVFLENIFTGRWHVCSAALLVRCGSSSFVLRCGGTQFSGTLAWER